MPANARSRPALLTPRLLEERESGAAGTTAASDRPGRGTEKAQPGRSAAPALAALTRHCIGRLEIRLARPARSAGDWSIALPDGCRCELCSRLGAFLADPVRQRLEWPLAEQGRVHIQQRINASEIPVRHETRRSGRPYTLILSKMEELFEREASERRSWQSDLARLRRLEAG